MAKWADKVIVAVHYSNSGESNRVIEKVKVFDYKENKSEDEKDELINGRNILREAVISDINKGTSYVTAYKNKDSGNYYKGKEVIVYAVKSKNYIKTEKNEKTEDNLDKIEEF
ncbi:DUF3892 domain-containing protein (plasmid) [Lactiplantibacillus plantarum]|jgi:hypothetical protein|uniref:DUF3892 domain-containing protein n=1 Tax=Lactiplantibacillus plantarum TaxID=1590 RepID=UPI000D31768F|nr:DUF3892 domain-containing protein [Lactiplantibacillus plantarum]MBJ7524759.1 DUF3892 domain-containing protein [Lactobacillus sp. CRM56-2]MBY7658990.1 DUF3892 domain-containing protein [Lactiplantibacillus plantarum]MCT3229233.1 DUF3892 domain-containing protein [Lactiplantibacillus plantarum]PTM26818.1 hypothetical protein DA799_16105 [Lactiplantibacillus plantarum]